MRAIRILLLLALASVPALSQINLVPPAVFIDPNTRSGGMDVKNMSPNAREVSVEFKFGYLDYNEEGKAYVRYDDSLAAEKYSLEPYIRVFPKKLILPPNEQQKIRFMVMHGPELPDQTYWVRVIVNSKPMQAQINSDGGGDVTTGLVISTTMIGAVVYQKGNCTMGMDISGVRAEKDSASLNLFVDYVKNEGNSPFFGTINITIRDSEGEIVDEHKGLNCVAYVDGVQKFSFEKHKYPPGEYEVELEVTNIREDIPKGAVLEFEPLVKTFEFTTN